MPEMSFFLDEHDVPFLLDRLNADSEIAFIVPDGATSPKLCDAVGDDARLVLGENPSYSLRAFLSKWPGPVMAAPRGSKHDRNSLSK